jgi:hypothetical protein
VNLPIERISNTNPHRFRWRQVVSTPDGARAQECEGTLPPSVEGAVSELIAMAERLAADALSLDEVRFSALVEAVKDQPEHVPGALVTNVAVAVIKRLLAENEVLRAQNLAHAERIVAQSELLSRRAEAATETQPVSPQQPLPAGEPVPGPLHGHQTRRGKR